MSRVYIRHERQLDWKLFTRREQQTENWAPLTETVSCEAWARVTFGRYWLVYLAWSGWRSVPSPSLLRSWQRCPVPLCVAGDRGNCCQWNFAKVEPTEAFDFSNGHWLFDSYRKEILLFLKNQESPYVTRKKWNFGISKRKNRCPTAVNETYQKNMMFALKCRMSIAANACEGNELSKSNHTATKKTPTNSRQDITLAGVRYTWTPFFWHSTLWEETKAKDMYSLASSFDSR